MRLKKTILFCVVVSLLAFSTKVIAEPVEIKTPNLTIEQQITYFSELYRADTDIVEKVIQCESRGKVDAVGDSGRSIGIAQFQKPTFKMLSDKLGEELDFNSSHDQIKLLSWSIANGYGKNWTAYRAIQNGGTYSFYSNQLKKHFKVTCR